MDIIREKACCFTGHRRIDTRESLVVKNRLRRVICEVFESGRDTFLAGGALGFDTLAAREVLRARDIEKKPIKLVLVLPCVEQTAGWSDFDKAAYRDIMERADDVIYTGDELHSRSMQIRNRYLVDHSSLCVCYLVGNPSRSGTMHTVNYAERNDVPLINVALAFPDEDE